MVKLKLLGFISELIGIKEKEIKLNSPIKLKNIIKLPKNIDLNRLIILVNGKAASPDTLVYDEDEVLLMPIVGGG